MAAERWVNDNGVARKIKERWLNDNGVARKIKERWVNDNGVARKVFTAGHSFSIIGALTIDGAATGAYHSGLGSISSGTLDTGETIVLLLNQHNHNQLSFSIAGFLANPGKSFFSNLIIDSISYSSASSTYGFSSLAQAGTWSWTANHPLIGAHNGVVDF